MRVSKPWLRGTIGSTHQATSPLRRIASVVAACTLPLVAGCGSDPEPASRRHKAPSTPDVVKHVVAGETFLGFPRLGGVSGGVQKDPTAWVAASPFPLYVDLETAVADMRRDGFVAGTLKIFKTTHGVGSSGSIAVQMRDATGAKAELERQLAQAKALPCPSPNECKQEIERFDVPGLSGATGIDLKSTLPQPETEDGVTFRVSHDITIVFTKGPFVQQLFAGGPGIDKKRDELIAAAKALAQQG
jgi:hypothetical protein